MPAGKIILSYLLTAVVFFAIDIIWLGFIGKGIYEKHLGHLLRADINWFAAIFFYFLFIIGIFVFVIMPAVHHGSLWSAMYMGGLFGLFTYATYDLTNLATLKGWSTTIVFIDIIWGMVLTSVVSMSGFAIVKWLQS